MGSHTGYLSKKKKKKKNLLELFGFMLGYFGT